MNLKRNRNKSIQMYQYKLLKKNQKCDSFLKMVYKMTDCFKFFVFMLPRKFLIAWPR